MKSLPLLVIFTSITFGAPLFNNQKTFQPSPNLTGQQQQNSNLSNLPWNIRVNGGDQQPTIIPNKEYLGPSPNLQLPFRAPPLNIPKPLTNSPGITQIPGMSLVTTLLNGIFNNGVPKNGIY